MIACNELVLKNKKTLTQLNVLRFKRQILQLGIIEQETMNEVGLKPE